MAQTTEIDDEEPEVLNATPARQGMRGKHILWVLIISSALAAAVLFGAWAMRSDDLSDVEPNNNAPLTNAQQFDQQDSPVRQVPPAPSEVRQ